MPHPYCKLEMTQQTTPSMLSGKSLC